MGAKLQSPRLKIAVALLCSLALAVAVGFLAIAAGFNPGNLDSYMARLLVIAGAMATLAIMLLLFWAWRESRALDDGMQELIHASELISRGEFTHPIAVTREDRLGSVLRAFDHMRLALRQTTYTKNYLYSVLNGMTEAVFVASNDGTIRVANEAASRLTGFSEEQLRSMHMVELLDRADRLGDEPLRVARDAGETVLRTQSGQTIPVSFTCSPIATGDHTSSGEIYVARDITERKRAERRIRYLARYDALTKIPNRMQFQHLLQQALARALRGGYGVALLYIDMDKFKEVNDTFGHGSGDRVLEVLTERLTRVLSSEAVLGRLAGDEFALFIDGVSANAEEAGAQVVQLARVVLDAAGAAFHINQQEVFLTVSIGVALCPRDAENVIDLIRNADAAMYYSKQSGGNTFTFYSQEMNAAAVERMMLKSKLRRAVERDEFVIRYQPKVDPTDGRIIGAEALLRWRLPGHGDIPPSQFIPLAEENNLINAIGEWVLDRVCGDSQQLARQGIHPVRISLNLSLKQLKQASFILDCRQVFERHGVRPEQLELEITETTLMADPRRTVQMLNQLHELGLHLSIDDFGTGYSSLSALQQFPIGTLKVDQSFVRNAATDSSDAVLVRTIIDMGHSLGMDVVAEGVETAEQLRFLRESQCDLVQGQLFGEPLGMEQLRELLITQKQGIPPFASQARLSAPPGHDRESTKHAI
ncbi:MAG: EAL domain-containing protein [Steroidobacteraceae bacterium]